MPAQPWMEQDFVLDLYINICKDTAQIVQKDGADYLLNAIKRSPHDSLYLRNLQLGYQASMFLAKRMEGMNMVALDLYDNLIKDVGLVQFIKFCERNPQIKKLDIGRNDISPEGIVTLSDSLQQKLSLEALELGTPNGKYFNKPGEHSITSRVNRITEKGAIALAQSLMENKTLRYLGLADTNFCEGGSPEQIMNIFGQMFAINQTLIAINLSGNKLGNFGITALLKGLTQNYNLQYLDISRNDITEQSMPLLAALLRQDTCHITYLNLSYNKLSPQGAKSLAFGLMGCRSLQSLNLESCDLRDDGVAIICSILSKPLPPLEDNNNENFNKSLTEVSGQQEGFDQSQQLFDIMERINKEMATRQSEKEIMIVDHQNNIVKNIRLARDQMKGPNEEIEERLMMHSQRMSEPNTAMESTRYEKENMFTATRVEDDIEMTGIENLNLANNGFGPRAFYYLNQMMRSPLQIKSLNISGNKIGSECVLQLAQTIINDQYDLREVIYAPRALHQIAEPEKITSDLQNLNISNVNLTDDAFIALCFVIAQLKSITNVNVSNNFIGDVGGQLGVRFLLNLETLTHFNVKNNQICYSTINQLNKILQVNRERVLQNGPNIIMQQIQLKKDRISILPLSQDELEYLEKTNVLLQGYIQKINTETNDHEANSFKVFENLKLQCEGAVENIKNGNEKLQKLKETQDNIKGDLGKKHDTLQKQLDDEMKTLQEIEAQIQEKETTLNQMKEKSTEIHEQMKQQLNEVFQQIQKVNENQKIGQKTIDMLRMKFKDVVERVLRSSVCGQLTYSMEYQEALPVLTRQQQVVQKGMTELPEQTGYDIAKAQSAGVAEKIPKEPKAKGGKKGKK